MPVRAGSHVGHRHKYSTEQAAALADFIDRSVVCSVVRFVSLVEHKATTYPTFDPTWYGPTAIVLSILEVDIATIMASLPVFWPYLRRNIDRIMITHEIEVKVTENFTQLEDESGARGNGGGGGGGAATPWEEQGAARGTHGRSGSGKVGTDVVMMRDLGRTCSDESGGLGLPFDGTQNSVRSPSRTHFLARESKEILLRT